MTDIYDDDDVIREGYTTEDGYTITNLRLTDSFEIHRDVWAVIRALRERADAAELRRMPATFTADALRTIADRLERATRKETTP
jgi:hypothetical protein